MCNVSHSYKHLHSCWRAKRLRAVSGRAFLTRGGLMLGLTVAMIGDACAPFKTQTMSVPQTSVITVPIHVVNDMLFVTASVDGHTGLWLLDSGGPEILINREYLQPATRPNTTRGSAARQDGLDTVIGPYVEDSALASGHVHVDATWESDSVTVQIGPLTLPLAQRSGVAVAAPLPKLFEAHWGVKPLGILGFAMVLGKYETVIDYAHQTMTLIPIDSLGRRRIVVPQYTPVATVPFIKHATEGGWFVEATIGGRLDTLLIDTGEDLNKLNVATPPHLVGHLTSTGQTAFDDLKQEPVVTADHLIFGGRSFETVPFSITDQRMDGLGTEFFRRLGAVGFNFRARHMVLYR